MNQPQTKSLEILNEIIVCIESKTVPNDIVLANLNRKVDALMKVDPSNAYMAKGMLCTIKKDVKNTIKNYEQAIRLGTGDEFYTNLFTSLVELRHPSYASKYIDEGCRKHPDSIPLLRSASSILLALSLAS